MAWRSRQCRAQEFQMDTLPSVRAWTGFVTSAGDAGAVQHPHGQSWSLGPPGPGSLRAGGGGPGVRSEQEVDEGGPL
eukprot:589452-Alexandrium_andersonii.AAC.1